MTQKLKKIKFDYRVDTVILNNAPNTKRIRERANEGWELISVVGGQMISSHCSRVATSFFYKRTINTENEL